MFPTRYVVTGRLCFVFILPTRALRELVMKRILLDYPELNYVVGWLDTGGFGLLMTIANWCTEQSKAEGYNPNNPFRHFNLSDR